MSERNKALITNLSALRQLGVVPSPRSAPG